MPRSGVGNLAALCEESAPLVEEKPATPAALGGTAGPKKADPVFAQFSRAWNGSVHYREAVQNNLHACDFAGDLSGQVPLSACVDDAA